MKKSKFKNKSINLFKRRAENKAFKANVAYLNRPGVRRYEELSYDLQNDSLHPNMSREEIKEWSDKNREWLCLAGMVGGWTPKRLASNGELVPIDCWKHCGIKPLRYYYEQVLEELKRSKQQ